MNRIATLEQVKELLNGGELSPSIVPCDYISDELYAQYIMAGERMRELSVEELRMFIYFIALSEASLFCEKMKELDKEYEISKNSPLHHDNRCYLCVLKGVTL